MFRTNLITTTQTPNPVLAIKSVAFKMLSNEKGFLSVEPRGLLYGNGFSLAWL